MDKWLYAREAAERMGISMRTLDRLDAQGITNPIQMTPGGRRRYLTEAIDRLIHEGVPHA